MVSMAFDQGLAQRVRELLEDQVPFEEKQMFGGLAFMVDGHMACGVLGDELVLRLGQEGASEALEEACTRPMDFTGRVIRTMVYVDQAGVATDEGLAGWLARALEHVSGLPPKQP